MERKQILEILMLLSALESWGFSAKIMFPDYLHERLSELSRNLSNQLLQE